MEPLLILGARAQVQAAAPAQLDGPRRAASSATPARSAIRMIVGRHASFGFDVFDAGPGQRVDIRLLGGARLFWLLPNRRCASSALVNSRCAA